MRDLRTDRKVVISQLMGSGLQVLAPASNVLCNLVILFCEVSHLITELSRIAPALNFDLTSDRAELINVARAHLLFNREKLQIELLLVCLRKEGDEELARLEHLRAKHSVQEALVVLLSFG